MEKEERKEKKEKKHFLSGVIGGIIGGLIGTILAFLILIGIGYGIINRNYTKKSNEPLTQDNSNIIEKIDAEINEMEHVIPNTGLKFVPKDNLKILSQKQIEEYFGANVSKYEIIAMDDTKARMLYMFIDDGEDAKKLDTTEYLKATFGDEEEFEITDIAIAGIGFKKTSIKIDEDIGNYILARYVCKIEDKFLVFDYCYPTEGENSFENMIVKE